MGIYNADANSIKSELLTLREKLVRAKTTAEKESCLSSINFLNMIYYSICSDEKDYFYSVVKNNKNKFLVSDQYMKKLNKSYTNNFIKNKNNLNNLSLHAVNIYSKELDKYKVPSLLEETIFSEDDAYFIIHSFFEKNYPEYVNYIDMLIKNKRLLRIDNFEDDKYEGLCLNTYKSDPFIVSKSPKYTIETITTLIHELGHAVDFNCINKRFSHNKSEKYLFLSSYVEVNSRLFEKQALEFFINCDINKDISLYLLNEYHYTNYCFLLQLYIFTLLPDKILQNDNYSLLSEDELKLIIPFEKYNIDIDACLSEEKIILRDSFTYGISGLLATIIDSNIKENSKHGKVLYNDFMANRTEPYSKDVFNELGLDGKDLAKCLKKEINYFNKNNC